MPITHTNAKGQTFTLHQGTTKTGKPKYYFAMRSEGTLAKTTPAGYEIYENPRHMDVVKAPVCNFKQRRGRLRVSRHMCSAIDSRRRLRLERHEHAAHRSSCAGLPQPS